MRSRSPFILIFLAITSLGILLTMMRGAGYLQYLELAAYDLMVSRTAPRADQPGAITLVLVSESDIQRLGNWPLNDAQLHDALTRLLALDPAVVGVDIYRDLPVPPGHDKLKQLLRDDDRLIAIEKFPGPNQHAIPPPPVLADSDRVGFSDLVTDSGGIPRRNLLFQTSNERTGFSFSLRLALAYLARYDIYPAPDPVEPSHIRLGDVTLPPLEGNEGSYIGADAAGYQLMLNYRAPGAFPVYSLADLTNGRLTADAVRDGIVIVGVASESVKDYFATPFSLLDGPEGIMPGTAVHAHAAQQLLDAALYSIAPLRSWSDQLEVGWLWLWIVLGFVAGWFSGTTTRFALLFSLGVAAAVSIASIAFSMGWWIPVVPNLAGWLLATTLSSAVLAAERRRDQQTLMSLFSCQVSPEVAGTIWQRRNEVLNEGQVRPQTVTVTTLFTDLQGFTRVSEQMDPEPFLSWLNSYMAELTDVIISYGGVLDDYAGDGIKASFGVPLHDPDRVADDAIAAVYCAMALGKALTDLNRDWTQRGRDCVGMRIGVHTGSVVAGTVGSSSRMKYTTVGRNVNLASRLECLKDYPEPIADDECQNCRILISEATADLVKDAFELSDIGHYDLKGIRDKVKVFAVLGDKEK